MSLPLKWCTFTPPSYMLVGDLGLSWDWHSCKRHIGPFGGGYLLQFICRPNRKHPSTIAHLPWQLRTADKCLPPLFCDLTRKLPFRLLPFQPRAWPFVTCRGSLWALPFPSGLNFPCNISAELRASGRADRPAVAGYGDAARGEARPWCTRLEERCICKILKGLLLVGAEMRPIHSDHGGAWPELKDTILNVAALWKLRGQNWKEHNPVHIHHEVS